MANGSPEILRRFGVKQLWYICPLENVEGILRLGILCHAEAHRRRVVKRRIDDPQVQVRRQWAACDKTPTWLPDYVNLFLAEHTPMLYVKYKEGNRIAHLEVDSELLLEDGVLFSDGNCACNDKRIHDNLQQLEQLDWEAIRSVEPPADATWGDRNREWVRKKSAEVLVPTCVPTKWLRGIHVEKDADRRRCSDAASRVGAAIPVSVSPGLYPSEEKG